MVLKYTKILLSDNWQVSASQAEKTAYMPTYLAQKAKIITDDFQQTN